MTLNAVVDAATEVETDQVTGLRLFTRTKVTPKWLCRAVVPAFRALQDDGTFILYVRRGWLHGPHVDLIAHDVAGQRFSWANISARLDPGPLAPEEQALSEQTYLDQAREFGRLERVPPPYLPLRPHATVESLAASDVALWSEPLDSMRKIALSRISRPLINTLERLADEPHAATIRVAEAFIAVANAHYLGAAFGVFSLRSHAEAFLAWASPRTDPRPAFGRRLVTDAPLLRPLVERILHDEPGPEAAGWQTAFGYCMGAFDGAVASGTLSLAAIESMGGGFDPATMGPPRMVAQLDPRRSAFHDSIDAAGITADPPEWFASYRLLINLFYQQLPLLGVSPMYRYYLCYAIAELIDEVLGESWQDRLNRLQRRIAKAHL
jgi:hypothetical protein